MGVCWHQLMNSFCSAASLSLLPISCLEVGSFCLSKYTQKHKSFQFITMIASGMKCKKKYQSTGNTPQPSAEMWDVLLWPSKILLLIYPRLLLLIYTALDFGTEKLSLFYSRAFAHPGIPGLPSSFSTSLWSSSNASFSMDSPLIIQNLHVSVAHTSGLVLIWQCSLLWLVVNMSDFLTEM